MTIKNKEELKNEIKNEVIYANIFSCDNYVSWYLDPDDGTWYSQVEASADSVPEAYWNGHDELIFKVNEQDYSDGDEDIAEIAEDEDTTTRELGRLYLTDKLEEKYLQYDWDDIFYYITETAMQELNERIDELEAE